MTEDRPDKYEVKVKVYLTGDSDDALKMAQALVDYAHDRPHVNNIQVSLQRVG